MGVEEAIRQLLAEYPEEICGEEKDIDTIMDNLQEIVDEEGQILDLDSSDVISFLHDNYTELTGNPEKDMYAEQEFDYEITEVADLCGISYDTLCEDW